jgi:hypothetical protein
MNNLLGWIVLILFGIFTYMKLAGIGEVASWSWIWVTSPLWIYFGLILIVLMILGFLVLTLHTMGNK